MKCKTLCSLGYLFIKAIYYLANYPPFSPPKVTLIYGNTFQPLPTSYSKEEFLERQRSIFLRIEERCCQQPPVCAVPGTQTGTVCFFSSWLSSMGKNWVSNSWTCNSRGCWRADRASIYQGQSSMVQPAGPCVDLGSSLLKGMSSLRGSSSFSTSSPSLLS